MRLEYHKRTFHSILYEYQGDFHYNVTLQPGKYLFECWGPQGFNLDTVDTGGKGAYTGGIINLNETKDFFLYVGQYGIRYYQEAFNGGGMGQRGGGGASDIRLTKGLWSDFESLKSRIMVAGGGGAPDTKDPGGDAGTLEGFPSGMNYGQGGNQTHGGDGKPSGSFGKGGGRYEEVAGNGNGGGGGGYFGGGASTVLSDYGGGGGSSYISGHSGCKSILSTSTSTNIEVSNESIHYEGYYFINTIMIDGRSDISSPTRGTERGHTQNGAIRITLIKDLQSCSSRKMNLIINVFIFVFISFSYS